MTNQNATSTVPMGTILAFALSIKNIPAGWLPCDGSNIPAKYDEFITALGSLQTPNLTSRTLLGAGVSAAIGTEFLLGSIGGEETHTLIIDEIPKHNHAYSYDNPLGAESPDIYSGSYWAPRTVDTFTDYTGGDKAHNNLQPYMAVNYIIYTGQNL